MDKDSYTIAAFDFDGTITTRDTLFDFIAFYYGKPRLIWGLILISPVLVLFKLGFIRNDKAKQTLLSYFFKGVELEDFNAKCKDYQQQISTITVPAALEKIRCHQQSGHEVIIVSASAVSWIQPWAESLGIKTVLGTKLEVKDNKLTGKIEGNNCYGPEKVKRLLEQYPDRDSFKLYAYGDSNGDKELLSIADYPFYRKF